MKYLFISLVLSQVLTVVLVSQLILTFDERVENAIRVTLESI